MSFIIYLFIVTLHFKYVLLISNIYSTNEIRELCDCADFKNNFLNVFL